MIRNNVIIELFFIHYLEYLNHTWVYSQGQNTGQQLLCNCSNDDYVTISNKVFENVNYLKKKFLLQDKVYV